MTLQELEKVASKLIKPSGLVAMNMQSSTSDGYEVRLSLKFFCACFIAPERPPESTIAELENLPRMFLEQAAHAIFEEMERREYPVPIPSWAAKALEKRS